MGSSESLLTPGLPLNYDLREVRKAPSPTVSTGGTLFLIESCWMLGGPIRMKLPCGGVCLKPDSRGNTD